MYITLSGCITSLSTELTDQNLYTATHTSKKIAEIWQWMQEHFSATRSVYIMLQSDHGALN